MTTMTETFKRACLGIALVSALTACSQIPEGHVGLPHSRIGGAYGDYLQSQGNTAAILTGHDYVVSHQILIDITDLKPKDKDNILLKDMDVTVAVKINTKNPTAVIEFIKEKGDIEYDRDGNITVGKKIVSRESGSSIQKAMHGFSSQEALMDKDGLEKAFAVQIQKDLELTYPGVFLVESAITQSIQVSEIVETKIQQTAAANAQKTINAALEEAIDSKKKLLIKDAQVLKEVANVTGITVDQLLQHNLITALANGHSDVKTVVTIPATPTPK